MAEVQSVEDFRGSVSTPASHYQHGGSTVLVHTTAPAHSGQQLDAADDERLFKNSVIVRTIPEGYNAGRTYYLKADSAEACSKLLDDSTGPFTKNYQSLENDIRRHQKSSRGEFAFRLDESTFISFV
jgi:hypothetical protein